MRRPGQRTNARQIAARHKSRRWVAIPSAYPKPSLSREDRQAVGAGQSNAVTAGAAVGFGRFRVLLRRRQLLADGVPVELGTRAFDLLLALLGADGSLVTREELMSRVWAGIVVSEENLKVQVSALRKALGADRDLIRTEFGRGYRFTGALYSNTAADICQRRPRPRLRSGQTWFPHRWRQSLRHSTNPSADLWMPGSSFIKSGHDESVGAMPSK